MSIDRDTLSKATGRLAERHSPLAKVLLALALTTCGSPPRAAIAPVTNRSAQDGAVLLSNGIVRIGVDPDMGGAITYLALVADGRNMVNDHDMGREIQQSYYAGPHPFGHPVGAWANDGWNPAASGDAFGHPAKAQVTKRADGTLYVRSTPYQWALDRVPCDCRYENWISLDGNRVHVRQRLTNFRTDRAQYPADWHEIPAVYVNGFLRRIATYTGARPFTGDAIARPAATWPTRRITATENWVALLDARDRGLGVINMATASVDVGVTSDRDGGEHDDTTGYISPRQLDILDHDITYDTAYTLVLGSAADIRAAAMALRPADARPVYLFQHDRQGWHYSGARDTGWPVDGRLRITATGGDPQIVSSERPFAAAAVPALYVTASFRSGGEAQLFWSTVASPGFSERHSLKVPVQPDGVMRTIRMPVASAPGWSGLITSLRFDPPGAAGAQAEICSIAWQAMPC